MQLWIGFSTRIKVLGEENEHRDTIMLELPGTTHAPG